MACGILMEKLDKRAKFRTTINYMSVLNLWLSQIKRPKLSM